MCSGFAPAPTIVGPPSVEAGLGVVRVVSRGAAVGARGATVLCGVRGSPRRFALDTACTAYDDLPTPGKVPSSTSAGDLAAALCEVHAARVQMI